MNFKKLVVVSIALKLMLLSCIATIHFVYADNHVEKYKRSHFGSGWIDEDGDCQNTRNEVLIRDSLWKVTLDKKGCKVLAGLWVCPYTGQLIKDPKKIDIDHMIPLEAAWKMGAWTWRRSYAKQYANNLSNPRHLLAVSSSANRSKGSKNPSKWMPANVYYWKQYIDDWNGIRHQWDFYEEPGDKFSTDDILEIHRDASKGFKFREVGTISDLNDIVH